jgi:hypothetical protein
MSVVVLGGAYARVMAAVRVLAEGHGCDLDVPALRAGEAAVETAERELAEAQRRHQAVEAALRHARGIVASEIADRVAQLRQTYQALNPSDRTATDQDVLIWASARPGHNNSGRLWAQIDERRQWLASWDAALEGR